MDMNKYYEYRQKIRTLYDQEPSSRNDLGSSVMEVREKNKCVISISFDIGKYYIEAECEEGTPTNKVSKICDTILDRIGYFLSDNLDSIPDIDETDKKAIEHMITSIGYSFCDHMIIGNMIKINL